MRWLTNGVTRWVRRSRLGRTAPALAGLVVVSGCGYNRIQSLDETANQAKHQIEVQLQRRADLIPNLVATVKGLAQQEQNVLVQVTQARSGLVSAIQKGDPAEMANANANLTGALGRLMVTVEAYPQIKSDQAFLRLQDELSGTENRIAVSRTDYNNAVRAYNAYIRTFPSVLTAKVTGAKPRAYFEVTTPGAENAPAVDFGTKK
jgi:LemA protein